MQEHFFVVFIVVWVVKLLKNKLACCIEEYEYDPFMVEFSLTIDKQILKEAQNSTCLLQKLSFENYQLIQNITTEHTKDTYRVCLYTSCNDDQCFTEFKCSEPLLQALEFSETRIMHVSYHYMISVLCLLDIFLFQ